MPHPRSLSLYFDQYKYSSYNYAPCLNSFGYFFFQAVSHDVQYLLNKRVCVDSCVAFNGCTNGGQIALVDSLRSESIDVLHVCSADPFYSYYGASCMTSPKVQTYNSDCTLRQHAPLNTVTALIDLSQIYYDTITPGVDGTYPNDGSVYSPTFGKFLIQICFITLTNDFNFFI